MDENTIFRPQPSLTRPQPVIGMQDVPASQQDVLINNPIVSPPPEVLPTSPPPSTFFKILKILLGVVFLLAIIFSIYNFVLPKLFPSKINQVTLTYWGLWEDPLVLAPIISDFEKEHPSIKVNYSSQNIKEYWERLITRSNNGNGP